MKNNYSYKERKRKREGQNSEWDAKEKKTRWRVTSAVLNSYIMTSAIQ